MRISAASAFSLDRKEARLHLRLTNEQRKKLDAVVTRENLDLFIADRMVALKAASDVLHAGGSFAHRLRLRS